MLSIAVKFSNLDVCVGPGYASGGINSFMTEVSII